MATDVEICQQALIMIGAQPINSFADQSTESTACNALYEDTVRDELARYPWRFATGQEQLSRLTDAPSAVWDAAYTLPGTCLRPDTVYVNSRPVDFDRYQNKIFCNATTSDAVYLEGVYRVPEATWPPYFTMLMVLRLASALAHSIAGQVETADYLDRRAVRHAAAARAQDAQSRTTQRLELGRLTDGRFRGARA